MLKQIWFGLSIFLVVLVILRPPKTLGLKSITNQTNLLGPPSSAEIILNNLTLTLMIIYCTVITVLGIYPDV